MWRGGEVTGQACRRRVEVIGGGRNRIGTSGQPTAWSRGDAAVIGLDDG
jgi:hypothetical protein